MDHKFNLGNRVECGVIGMRAQIQSISFIFRAAEPRYQIMYQDVHGKIHYAWYSESELELVEDDA